MRQKNEFFPNVSKFSPNVLYTFIFKDTTVAQCEKKGKKYETVETQKIIFFNFYRFFSGFFYMYVIVGCHWT
jgi:hypothetical protein